MVYEERLPGLSSELLRQYFNLKPEDIGKKARQIVELQPPQSQGSNTYALADYIVRVGNVHNNPNYMLAENFIYYYEHRICYICGGKIAKESKVDELEHLLPVAEALCFGLINQTNFTQFKTVMDEIYDKDVAEGYLLEYAKSHRCCNQLKSSISFFTFDGSPPYESPYKINESEISILLKKIWINVVGTGELFQKP